MLMTANLQVNPADAVEVVIMIYVRCNCNISIIFLMDMFYVSSSYFHDTWQNLLDLILTTDLNYIQLQAVQLSTTFWLAKSVSVR